jgi:AcrR family transcriptional regulator
MSDETRAVTEKILASAKAEFLEKGFEKASLRCIAQKADSSKSAIYRRYSDKASLFMALVNDIADETVDLIRCCYEEFFEKSTEEQLKVFKEASEDNYRLFTEYIYKHFDDFKLLISCSDNTVLSNFIQRLAEQEVNSTFRFFMSYAENAVSNGRLTPGFVHLVSEAFFTGVFQVIVYDMPREKGEKHIKRLKSFFSAGWMATLEDLSLSDKC